MTNVELWNTREMWGAKRKVTTYYPEFLRLFPFRFYNAYHIKREKERERVWEAYHLIRKLPHDKKQTKER